MIEIADGNACRADRSCAFPPINRVQDCLLHCAIIDFVKAVVIISQRILEAKLPDAVFVRRDSNHFVEAANQASRLSAIKRLLLAEPPGLQLARAIDRTLRPFVNPPQVKSMLAPRSFALLMISLHDISLSGSASFDAPPRS